MEDQTQVVKEERKTSTSTSITSSSREQKGTTKNQAQLIKERKPKEKGKAIYYIKKCSSPRGRLWLGRSASGDATNKGWRRSGEG